MADGFPCLVLQNLQCRWIEPTLDEVDISHTAILQRLGWSENKSNFVRFFVRVQFPSWKEENFEPDEDGTLPGWAENNWGEVQQKATKLLQLVRPIREKYIDIYKELLSMRDNSITKGMTRHIRDKLFEQSCNVFNKRVEEASKDMINECRLIEGYVPD